MGESPTLGKFGGKFWKEGGNKKKRERRGKRVGRGKDEEKEKRGNEK